jgi:hypothetical protein
VEAIINMIPKIGMLLSMLFIGACVYGLIKSIINIVESIITKIFGEYIEAIVISGERKVRNNIVYELLFEFTYKGNVIQVSKEDIVEKDLFGVENYIGKKYMIYYHEKCDYMIVEKQFFDKLKQDIFLIIASIYAISFGNILLFKNDVMKIFIIILIVGCICMMGAIILIGIWGIFSYIKNIYKIIMTKKHGELIEATVVQADKTVDSKSGTTFYTICYDFEYNGNKIRKSDTIMKDSKILILSEKDLIGQKYNIYYSPKFERSVLCQYYKSNLTTSISLVLFGVVFLSMITAVAFLDDDVLRMYNMITKWFINLLR